MKEDWITIVNHFGFEEQLKHWFTEIRELTQAIDAYDSSEESREHIKSELADNYNFLGQIQAYFQISDEEVREEQLFKNMRTINEMGRKNDKK